jgi:hypothetical protein
MLRKIIIILLITTLLAACEQHVKGNGVTKVESRNLPPFTTLRVVGNYQVNVISGQLQKISVNTDENLLPYIITKLHGDTLVIDSKRGYHVQPTATIQINIAVQNLKDVGIIGNSTVKVVDISTDKFAIKILGSGSGIFDGKAQEVFIKSVGAGRVLANNLISSMADVRLIGSSVVSVYANKKLTIKISGNSKVQYFGQPREVEQKISGNGAIEGISNVKKNPS